MDETTPVCPVCGKPMAPDAPQGLCTECLMKAGFETKSGAEPGGGNQTVVPPSAETVARLFPQLEIFEMLGAGGMGTVYKARQLRLNRFVALKILAPGKKGDPRFAERFEREARALASLNHPNIVAVYDFGEVQGNHYLMMEFVDGMTLRRLLQTRKPTPAEALNIVQKICEALQYAHEQGIVHRDIKPENILIDKNGRIKIADFGIAKILEPSPRDISLTGAREVVGTSLYMAPEQIEKPQTVDCRADIFSLGVVLYEMLTGELPLGKFQPPSQKVQIDVRVDEVVLHALEKEPERRYQKVSEVKTDVETIKATPDKTVPPKPAISPLADKMSNDRKLAIVSGVLGFVALIFLLCAAVFFLRKQQNLPSPPRQGLVALWSGEDKGKDSIGRNNVILTDVSFTNSEIGPSFSLNGVSSYMRIPYNSSMDVGEEGGGITILAWIKPSDVSGIHTLIEWNPSATMPGVIGCQLSIGHDPYTQGVLQANIVDANGRHHILYSPPGTLAKDAFSPVAVTYDKASGVGALYINAVMVAQEKWESFVPLTKGDLWVGLRPSNPGDWTYNAFFAGLLDEIAIYNRALSPYEIQTYAAVVAKEKNLQYDQFIQHQPVQPVQPLQPAHPFQPFRPVQPVQPTPSITRAPINPNPPAALPRKGLVALWSGEGNGNDSVGTNTAILTDMSFEKGIVGSAFSLNGVSSYMKVPYNSSLDFGEEGDGITISAWIKPSDVSGIHTLIEWNPSLTTMPGVIGCQIAIGHNPMSQGVLLANIVDADGGHHILISSPYTLVKDTFQHVAVTYDRASGVGILYLNGDVVARGQWESFAPLTKGDFWVGLRPSNPGDWTYNAFYSGLLDEIAIYNRALSANEIKTYLRR